MQYKAFISYSHSIDGDFSPALQTALQQFGKPWYKMRSFRVFRDGTNLSSNPNLWKNITEALSYSEFFILLASPEAGNSKWVNMEVEEWLKNNNSDKMIIALTSGDWDPEKLILPVALRQVLEDDPFYVDFRNIKKSQDLELGNPEFKTKVAQILSVLENRPVGDIIGQEVVQHKRTIRLRNGIITVLSILLLITTVLVFTIRNQREQAQKEALANRLVSLSLLQEKTDATSALSTVNNAINILPNNSVALMTRNDIYSRNLFYKKIYSDHLSSVYQVKFLSDSLFLSSSADNAVKLHHVNGEVLLELHDESNTEMTASDMSLDELLIATGDKQGYMKLWDRDGRMFLSNKVNSGAIEQLEFTPDGKYILTGGLDAEAKLWKLNGEVVLSLEGHLASLEDVAVSPDGKHFLTGSADATAILWDLKGKRIKTFKGHESQVTTVAFSPDGTIVLTGSMDQSVRLWNLDGSLRMTMLGHNDGITDAEFLSEDIILTASYDNTIRTWDLKGNELNIYKGHNETVTSISTKKDGTEFLSSSWDKTVKLWDTNCKLLNRLPNLFSIGSSFNPAMNQLLIGGGDKDAKLWNYTTDSIVILNGHNSRIRTSTFSKSGGYLLTGFEDGTIKLWSNSGKEIATIPGHNRSVNAVAFYPDEKKFLSTGEDGNVKEWNLNGDSIFSFQAHSEEIYAMKISPDGSKILTGSVDGTAKIWGLKGNSLHSFEDTTNFNNIIYSVDFSPNGKNVVTGGISNNATIWSLDGQKNVELKGHTRAINTVEFSHDGNYLITCSGDNSAIIWNLKGDPLFTLYGTASNIFEARFSPDDKYILTTDQNGCFLWRNLLNEFKSPLQ